MVFEQHVEGVGKLLDPPAAVPPQWYRAPAWYFTNPCAIVGPDEPVPSAPGSTASGLVSEVAAVIGRPGTDLTPEQAEPRSSIGPWTPRRPRPVDFGAACRRPVAVWRHHCAPSHGRSGRCRKLQGRANAPAGA
ncbi:fumarylacetoacetate hydrolase family protein [Streptomyces sp. NPDC000070]|uniref:fumarylacetoacetate hydrolase family protein n=1 Tax=Streptomyces sp. NPDC000070 TaxID=3154240 RepID=UPI0033180090